MSPVGFDYGFYKKENSRAEALIGEQTKIEVGKVNPKLLSSPLKNIWMSNTKTIADITF